MRGLGLLYTPTPVLRFGRRGPAAASRYLDGLQVLASAAILAGSKLLISGISSCPIWGRSQWGASWPSALTARLARAASANTQTAARHARMARLPSTAARSVNGGSPVPRSGRTITHRWLGRKGQLARDAAGSPDPTVTSATENHPAGAARHC